MMNPKVRENRGQLTLRVEPHRKLSRRAQSLKDFLRRPSPIGQVGNGERHPDIQLLAIALLAAWQVLVDTERRGEMAHCFSQRYLLQSPLAGLDPIRNGALAEPR